MKKTNPVLVISGILLVLAAILGLSLSLGFGLIVHAIGASGLAAALIGLVTSAVIAVVLFYTVIAIACAKLAKKTGLLAFIKELWTEPRGRAK